MLSSDFDYDLPPEAIAQRPARRGQSRLLVLGGEGEARHRRIADLPALLRAGDLLVVNDTRVLPARLYARRAAPRGAAGGRGGAPEPHAREADARGALHGGRGPSGRGGRVQLLLLEKTGHGEWLSLAGPGRRARSGDRLLLADGLEIEVVAVEPDGKRRLRFAAPVEPHLEALGHVPLPPYIRRRDEASDRSDYQTIFAREPGAVAAPTAGLHFTSELVAALAEHGIPTVPITLHVGIGTFRPVTAERVEEHRMDEERWIVPEPTAAAIRAAGASGGRIVAVGTTVVRTLESAAHAGGGTVAPGAGRTDLFITPGYPFRAVDLLLTNFHLPRSTLLMLVSAFAGRERVLAAYREAITAGYRFYSYGDAMLVERAGTASAPSR